MGSEAGDPYAARLDTAHDGLRGTVWNLQDETWEK
jgi:hypothetical protein